MLGACITPSPAATQLYSTSGRVWHGVAFTGPCIGRPVPDLQCGPALGILQEMHHVAAALTLMQQPDFAFLPMASAQVRTRKASLPVDPGTGQLLLATDRVCIRVTAAQGHVAER